MRRPETFLKDPQSRSDPPQWGVFSNGLPVNDSVTKYLKSLVNDPQWPDIPLVEEWDWCWDHLPYLPSWDFPEIWEGPQGWLTAHQFICWLTWHVSVAHAWLYRLNRHLRRGHSLDALLSDARPIPATYQYINKQQVHIARVRCFKAMRYVHAGHRLFLPTAEVVKYPPDGLFRVLDEIDKFYDFDREQHNWTRHARSCRRADYLKRELPDVLRLAATLTKRHLGDSGWSD